MTDIDSLFIEKSWLDIEDNGSTYYSNGCVKTSIWKADIIQIGKFYDNYILAFLTNDKTLYKGKNEIDDQQPPF